MKYSPTPNHQFENFTLKRDKGSFRMSTAAFSTARTPAHSQNNNLHQYPPDNQQTQKPIIPSQQPHPTPTLPTTHNPNPTNQLQNSSSLKTLASIIQHKKTGCQTLTSHTHSYYQHSACEPHEQPVQSPACMQIISKHEFPPKIIKQLCSREQQKQTDGNIEYHYGMLSQCGYLYFCIQKLLVFVRSFNYLVGDQSQNQQPIILEMDNHALAIKQIVVADLDIEDIQRHPFGSKSIIFMIWFQWRVQFLSYQPYQLIKIKSLNLKFDTSNQSSFLFDYTKSGDIFYLTQQGQLSKLQFFQPSSLFFFIKNNKKYSIKQYFYKFKHNTKRKHQTYIKSGFFDGINQFWKDVRYFWKQKIRKGIKIVCDRDHDRVLTLVETRVRRGDGEQDDVHREIRVYDVAKDRNKGVMAKLQSSMYHNPPHLLLQITEQKLYSQIGIHLFNSLNISKFQFSNIHIPPHSSKSRHPTNLLIVLQTGNRLYLHISSQRMVLNQMINLPNIDEILISQKQISSLSASTKVLAYRDGHVNGKKIISQKENIGFRVIRDQFVGGEDFVVVGAMRKAVVGVGFGRWGVSGETVAVIHDVPIEADQKTSSSIFINYSDYSIFKCPQIYETRPKKHLQHLLNKSPLPLPHLPHILTHQCLHYPSPTLVQSSQSQIKILLKQRPIDKILSIINNELNKIQKNINKTNILYNDAEIVNVIQKLCQCMEGYYIQRGEGIGIRQAVVEMLVQIYCDVDGVYYFQMLKMRAGGNRQRKNVSMQGQRESFNYNNRNMYQNSNSTQAQNRRTQPIPSPNTHPHKPPTYKKYRHSDLCTSQPTNYQPQQTTINRSPLKIRSDNSMIKFVERLIVYSVKMEANKIQFKNKIKQGQWVYAVQSVGEEGSKANWEGVERILLGYIGRILGCVWEWKIQDVDRSVFNYIAELCQKYLQLLTKITDFQPSINLTSLSNLLTILHQFNKLLHQLLIPIPMSYSSALLQPITIFAQPIFLTLQKQQNSKSNNSRQTLISSTLTKYRQQFPYYFSLDLFKTIKLQAQINNVANLQDRRRLVLKEAYRMPKYLLRYYVGAGVVGVKEVEGLIKRDMTDKEGQIQLKGNYRINQLLEIVKGMDPYQKYEYLMTQIQKDTYILSQKQILLTYSTKFLQSTKTLSPSSLKSHQSNITHLTTILKLQQQIIKYLQKQGKQQPPSSKLFNIGIGNKSNPNPNKIEISDKTKYLLNNILMTTTQLKKLVISLGSKTVLFIFYACFCEGSQDVQIGLRDMVWEEGGKEENVRGVLMKVFDMGAKIRLSSLAPVLDQICYNNIQTHNLKPLLSSPLQTLCQTLWIPKFLFDHKYNKNELYNHYTTETKKHHIRISLKKNKQFMYNWLNAYIIVKMYYTQARRMFQVFTQALGQGGDGEEGEVGEEIRELGRVLEESFKL